MYVVENSMPKNLKYIMYVCMYVCVEYFKGRVQQQLQDRDGHPRQRQRPDRAVRLHDRFLNEGQATITYTYTYTYMHIHTYFTVFCYTCLNVGECAL